MILFLYSGNAIHWNDARALGAVTAIGFMRLIGMTFAQSSDLYTVDYNETITDLDPILQYTPQLRAPTMQTDDPQGYPMNSWNITDSGMGWNALPEQIYYVLRGTSTHVTSLKGATVSLEWVGSAVYFWGTLQGDVSLAVDGADVSPANSLGDVAQPEHSSSKLVAVATGLTQGNQKATLTLQSGNITGVTYTLGVSASGCVLSSLGWR